MISVEVKINRKTVVKITATQIRKLPATKVSDGWREYKLNCGCKLKHDRNLGVLCMLIQMAGHAQISKKCKYINHA